MDRVVYKHNVCIEDYKEAKNVVESVPSTFMTNISDKEADLTKKALEFVGAKVEIR